MSVISLCKDPRVQVALDALVAPPARPIPATLCAPPLTDHYALVGTAFDYFLRFELARRCRRAVVRGWVAESSVFLLRQARAEQTGNFELYFDDRAPDVVVDHAKRVLATARKNVKRFRAATTPPTDLYEDLARDALELARLDRVYREQWMDYAPAPVDARDVQDLLRLLAVVPFERLTHPRCMHLNPTFPEGSVRVGGADCDLIVGSSIIDIKVTQSSWIKPEYVRQLLSYVILSDCARQASKQFPRVDGAGIYFARHGHVWDIDLSQVLGSAIYATTKDAYLSVADEMFGGRKDLRNAAKAKAAKGKAESRGRTVRRHAKPQRPRKAARSRARRAKGTGRRGR